MADSKVGSRLKAQLTKFSLELSEGLPRPSRKFIQQMLYGIQASQDVKLSSIARSLQENIPLIKTEDRLSRNLAEEELETHVLERVARMGSQRVGYDTVLSLDLSDVRKEYARKMEYLDQVWDGSRGEAHAGYWLCEVTAVEVRSSEIVPLYQKLYSSRAPEYGSENLQLLRAIDGVGTVVGWKGIWVMDRGGDRRHLLGALLERQLRFVIRSTGRRTVIDRRQLKGTVAEVAGGCRLPHAAKVIRIEDGKEKVHQLRYGAELVHLPDHDEPLLLVVVAGFGSKPLMLLTNLAARARDSESLWKIVEIYLARWKIEETLRFLKQSYHLEDLRVLSYRRLQNLAVLVLAAAYFASAFLGQKLKLKVLCEKLLIISRRFFGTPPFRFYALADAIRQVLSHSPPPAHPPPPDEWPLQLFLAWRD